MHQSYTVHSGYHSLVHQQLFFSIYLVSSCSALCKMQGHLYTLPTANLLRRRNQSKQDQHILFSEQLNHQNSPSL
jgi:hypothetical protein